MRLFEGTPFDIPPKCDHCDRAEADCVCDPKTKSRIPPAKQTAQLRIEKRKNGRLVTVISGLPAAGNDLPALLTALKNQCGAGGTIDGGVLEVQGQHIERVEQLLLQMGYRVRTSKK